MGQGVTSICSACQGGDGAFLCDSCRAKTKRISPASRSTVNWAARRTLKVVAVKKRGEETFIEEWYESGRDAGKNW